MLSDRQPRISHRRIGLTAALIALVVFLFRFNALGGTLGGFDDDHFLALARSNQLLDGEWPLRDYPDFSLQGAWPPLAYLPSAAAQLVFGRSLLAEALLTTGAIAVSAALTFVAATRLGTPTALAVAAALVSVIPSVRLYGWARPVLFALLALLIHRYATHPTIRRLATLSVLAAVAFLVRHDYAIYFVPGIAAAVVTRHLAEPRVAARRTLLCGAIAGLLLIPSILSVQLLLGVRPYVDGISELVDSERRRTDNYTPRFDWSDVLADGNAEAWLYCLFFVVPVAAAVVAVWRRRRADSAEAPTIVGIAVTTIIGSDFLLRNNLAARLADPAVLLAILAAWLLAVLWRRPRPWPVVHYVVAAVAAAVVIVSIGAMAQVGALVPELRSARFTEGPVAVVETTIRIGRELRDTPPTRWDEPYPAAGPMLAAAYLHECTSPSDRILNARYSAEALVLARRRFGAGRANFAPGHYASERQQRDTVALARRQSIPVVLMEPLELAEDFGEDFPIVDAFVRDAYTDVGAIRHPDREYARVLARKGLEPVSTFGSTGLPCFR